METLPDQKTQGYLSHRGTPGRCRLRSSLLRWAAASLVLLALVILGLRPALAAPGDLDPTFGGGWVITDFGGRSGVAYALTIQPDGKLVAAGQSGFNLALARFNPDGSLDPTFGVGGRVTTDFGVSDTARALILQPNGKLVVAGGYRRADLAYDFALARFNPDGSLDSTFGVGGRVTTDFGEYYDFGYALILQPDGKLVAAGYSGRDNFALARYNADGSLDPTFGVGGKVTTTFNTAYNEAYALTIQPDGKLVAAGMSEFNLALVRFNPDGSLDPTFGVGGRVTTDFGGDDEARALVIQPDGKLVAAGYSWGGPGFGSRLALARYNADGSLDPTFGVGGKVTTTFNTSYNVAYALTIQPDGKLVAAGYSAEPTWGGPAEDFALARFNPDGSLDPTFGVGGKVTTYFGGSRDDIAFALVLQPDGKLVAAGVASTPTIRGFTLARYEGTATPPPNPPVLSISPASLDFATVPVSSSKDLSFTVTNTGGGTLTGNASASAPYSIVPPNSFNLTAGQSQDITVRFAPSSAGAFLSNVSVTSNGGNASIALSGDGVFPIELTILGPPGPTNRAGSIAEPVNTATGNYVFQRTDLTIPGRGLPFVFTRTYNSADTYAGPLGHGWTHSYNTILTEFLGGSVAIKQGDGHVDFFEPTGGGTYQPHFGGVFDVLVKTPDGTFTLTKKNQTHIVISSTGKLTSMTDRNGNNISFFYDGAGNLTAILDTEGRVVSLTYDANSRITQLTDPIGRTIIYTYDVNGNLVRTTDPLGLETTYAYDATHQVTQIVDALGNVLVGNTYDASGRVITQANGRGFVTTFAYDTPTPGDTTITDPRGNETIHTHDVKFRLVQVKDPNGGFVSFTYDADNNRTSITDQNVHTTLFTYDSRGNVTSIIDPLGNILAFTYDAQNNLTSAVNARGFITTLSYDPPGNLTGILDALGNTTILAYDSFGQLIRKTDARGNVTRYTYDGQGNVTGITDALGGATTLAYDGIGRLLNLTDPNGHTAGANYDANSRLTRITDPLAQQTQFFYDAVGNLTRTLDANGNQTQYGYDAVNNLTAATDALNHITQYAYDANNNRIALTDANNHMTAYNFDSLNHLAKITDPLGNFSTYTYDPVRNVVAVKDANGTTNTFNYDANNRLIGIAYGDGSSVTYSYDANGNRVSMVDSRGTTTYVYDALDRLVQVIHPDTSIVRYGYDSVGNRTGLTYPDGRSVTYGYDALNRLAQVVDREGKVTQYTYDPASNLLKVSYPNGTAISYQHDVANRLVMVKNLRGKQLLSSYSYTLDALGNRVQTIKDNQHGTSYAYDALSQLVAVASPGSTQTTYSYDPAGNLLAVAGPGRPLQLSYDGANRLLRAGNTTYSYDANGSRISMDNGVVTRYAYDAANRLIQASRGGLVSTYQYDGDGNKVEQMIGSKTLRFTNDVATILPVILTESGPSSDSQYVYGRGLISQTASASKYFYHYDGLGSVVNLTSPSGGPVAVYAYDPWGAPQGGGHASTVQNRFRFTGEELDEFSELYYLRARWYDPTVGRFLTRDPFTGFADQPASLNLYVYVRNNPVRLVDPFGLTAAEGGVTTDPDAFVNIGGFRIRREKLRDPVFLNRLQAEVNEDRGRVVRPLVLTDKQRQLQLITYRDIAKVKSDTETAIEKEVEKAEERARTFVKSGIKALCIILVGPCFFVDPPDFPLPRPLGE